MGDRACADNGCPDRRFDLGSVGFEVIGMNKFSRMWADQLRAGALQIAEQAETIVGDMDMNLTMDVTIHLSSGNGQSFWPSIEIRREIASKPMNEVLMRRSADRKEKQDDSV